jgi:hypothetical protein
MMRTRAGEQLLILRAGVGALSLCAVILTACGAPTGAGSPVSGAPQKASGLQAVLVSSQVLVGRQRLALGVLDRNTPINDARVHIRVYRGSPADPLADEGDAPFKGDGLQGRGVYVAYVNFGAPGAWVVDVAVRTNDRVATTSRLPVTVETTGSVPSPGRAAPRSRNPTQQDVADVADIDSGLPPDDMHELSIAQAIDQHRPALIVFATPAFCTSAMCGPEVHAVQQLEPAYRDRVGFIHVEIYQDFKPDPSKMTLTTTVREWHLQTEPWVFLVDASGTIRYAFEGPTATDELRAALDAMLGSS